MIGHELENKTELLEWFLGKGGVEIRGFTNVIYSGITTVKMAEFVLNILKFHPTLYGLYNVATDPISKFNLLNIINHSYGVGALIKSDDTYISNKALVTSNFYNVTGFKMPCWEDLIDGLKADKEKFRNFYN